ncbi:hypothetical protein AX777_15530 [Sphingobium yanoikuyae]|uniref:DUF1993 domain-containing protein n=1 Tax=Sphingobium yanoikuyae TaxID=13690 RepID=A0A177K3W5_SPHYA|nr:DUF1993 domain-containing protein [Sphingobium yanoikuyae]OAH47251.1 hypothetical protein AX777_15530 [Sphingobium yanoikuyae]PZU64970.1 MAG: DUF1993 domain-containing protein [Sphingobium sp.]
MATELYDLTVPAFLRGLRVLSTLLDKGAAFAAEQGIDPATLTDARLIEDMRPLTAQVQLATDSAKGAVIRIGELEPFPLPDTEETFADLQDRIARTIAFLESVPRDRIDGREEATVILKTPRGEFPFTGRSHVLTFSLPNFYFHLTTAYALLRQAGVPLGKLDYLGGL